MRNPWWMSFQKWSKDYFSVKHKNVCSKQGERSNIPEYGWFMYYTVTEQTFMIFCWRDGRPGGGGGQIFFVITEIIYFYFLILYFQIFWFQSRSKTSSQPTNHYAVGIVNIMYIYSIIHSYICNLKIYNPLYMYKCYLSIRLKRKTNVTIKNKYSHISFNIC